MLSPLRCTSPRWQGIKPTRAFKQLGAPGAQQAVNTDHFAFAEGEGDVIELVTAAGMQRGQPFDVKHCVAFWRRLIIKVFFLSPTICSMIHGTLASLT